VLALADRLEEELAAPVRDRVPAVVVHQVGQTPVDELLEAYEKKNGILSIFRDFLLLK
jgi:hypothetical protein